MPTVPQPSVVERVTEELAELDIRKPGLASTGYAAMALVLAAGLDDKGAGFSTKVAAAKELREALNALRALAPEGSAVGDPVDEMKAARERRRASAAGR